MTYRDYDSSEDCNFNVLVGKTLKSVENLGEEILFKATTGETYRQIYYEDCCATCSVEDICGDLEDLVGSKILMAEESTSTEPDQSVIDSRKAAYEKEKSQFVPRHEDHEFYHYGPGPDNDFKEESETWTFYKIATIKGSVTIRWYGSSNGYYSETATFEKLK